MTSLVGELARSRIVVCTGAGGVGKTTVAASLALGLAAQGRRVALVTIDPARRLSEALGLDDLGNDPQPVDPEPFERSGLVLGGELSAMMLSVKRTFDELVGRLAPDRATLEQILANPVYQQLSTAVAGSQEYTAVAKLWEIDRRSDYDVIVLDTPPSRSAVDFLLAPQRLRSFLSGRALSMLIRPAGLSMRMTGLVFGALRRIVGVGLLDDLRSFFGLMAGLVDGFREQAGDVESLLADPTTAFLIVSSAESDSVEEAIYLGGELARLGLRQAGLVLNRLHPFDAGGSDVESTATRLTPALGEELAARVATTHSELQRWASLERHSVDRLRAALGGPPTAGLLDRGADVHDARGLVGLQAELFEASGLHYSPAGER
jgi:anion-transporting  ArsA/GET3 family ATPase